VTDQAIPCPARLPSASTPLGLPLGKHLYLRATINGEMVMRPYTPTSLTTDRGAFDLVIKVYLADQDPRYPLGGKMSQHLDR
jgi:nitrate reductase (NAD(P)H)